MCIERAIDFAALKGMVTSLTLQKWTRKRIRNRRRLKKLEAKFGKKVNENGEPIDEEDDVPETVEEVRRMRYKIHPICKLCNLQSWNDRKNKKKVGVQDLSHIVILKFIIANIAYTILKNIVGQVITQFILNIKKISRMKLVVVKTKMITSIMMKKVMKYELMFQKIHVVIMQQWLMLVIIVKIFHKIWRKVNRITCNNTNVIYLYIYIHTHTRTKYV